jgi:hypothetical protein
LRASQYQSSTSVPSAAVTPLISTIIGLSIAAQPYFFGGYVIAGGQGLGSAQYARSSETE